MQNLPQLIVQEACRQVLAKGVRGTSLDAVAATLHISKKTIYKHFATKTALLHRIWHWYRQRVEADFWAFGQAPSAPEELGLVLRWFREQHAALLPGFMAELRRVAPAQHQAWQQYCTTWLVPLLARNLRRGQVEGAYRPLNTEVLSRLCVVQLEHLRDGLPEAAAFSSAHLHRAWGDLFLRGILRADWPGGLPAH